MNILTGKLFFIFNIIKMKTGVVDEKRDAFLSPILRKSNVLMYFCTLKE